MIGGEEEEGEVGVEARPGGGGGEEDGGGGGRGGDGVTIWTGVWGRSEILTTLGQKEYSPT